MSIEEALKVEHTALPPLREEYHDGLIISVILDCYFGIDYIKQSIKSVLDQDYINVELMLINNGASEEIATYLNQIFLKNKNIFLISFEENQFSWSDREKPISICWNVALHYCRGEIVTHLSYDDMFSKNYARKMANLFDENNQCITAAPLPILINSAGERIPNSDMPRLNQRPRFSDGKDVALDFVSFSPKNMFNSPGEIFAIRKKVLLKYGGFEQGVDLLQLIKYAIHGVTGFDSDAHVYWRSHEFQTNRISSAKGHVSVKEFKRIIKRSKIIDIWRDEFSQKEVVLLKKYLKNHIKFLPFTKSQNMISDKNLSGLLLVFFYTAKECPELLFQTISQSIVFVFKIIFKKIKSF